MASKEIVRTHSTTAFPDLLPESDRKRWEAMTPVQRARASDRLAAIAGWRAGEIALDQALASSGLSRTRFYAVAADFRATGSLKSLGAFAGVGASRKRLDPDAVNALQAVVSDVVAMNNGASVLQMVRLMVEASGVDESRLPGSTRLREIVDAEIRRVEATGQAGHALKLDVTAINLPRADGRPHIMFTLIDEGTRLVFGACTAGLPEEEAGYRAAATDALSRLSGSLSSLRWADRLVRIEITVGADRDAGPALRACLVHGGVHAHVQLARARYGRYFRKLIGPRIGRVEITPLRTEEGLAVPDNGDMTPWTDEAATVAVQLAVDQHNAAILQALDVKSGRQVMPDDLSRSLEILAN